MYEILWAFFWLFIHFTIYMFCNLTLWIRLRSYPSCKHSIKVFLTGFDKKMIPNPKDIQKNIKLNIDLKQLAFRLFFNLVKCGDFKE